MQARLKAAGLEAKKHVMDNEVSADLKECIEKRASWSWCPPDAIAETWLKLQ